MFQTANRGGGKQKQTAAELTHRQALQRESLPSKETTIIVRHFDTIDQQLSPPPLHPQVQSCTQINSSPCRKRMPLLQMIRGHQAHSPFLAPFATLMIPGSVRGILGTKFQIVGGVCVGGQWFGLLGATRRGISSAATEVIGALRVASCGKGGGCLLQREVRVLVAVRSVSSLGA